MSQATITVFVVGDVMLGRGIDMILPHHNDPILYEDNGLNAFDYVSLAERQNGPLPPSSERGVSYIWGDAIQILDKNKPDVRIINLETSVTTSSMPWPNKGIHYRMHPDNIDVVKAAQINCCILANNHVADWGFEGLHSTLTTLKDAGIKYAGAGHNQEEVASPAIFEVPDKGRVLVFAAGHHSSGVPDSWKASRSHGGVNIIEILKPKKAASELHEMVSKYKQENDIVVLSLHWGGNWGFDIDPSFKKFAYAAIDNADIDLIYGHSSHHVKGVEIYHDKLIIYGCGDFLNDYEGITGHGHFRDDLALMYFVEIDPLTGKLVGLRMVPTQTKHMRVNNAPEEGIQWLLDTMKRECKKLGTLVERNGNELHLVL
jgi:poly-gamma-glutamate synthesis protein (capsule biosynthesis protein)